MYDIRRQILELTAQIEELYIQGISNNHIIAQLRLDRDYLRMKLRTINES